MRFFLIKFSRKFFIKIKAKCHYFQFVQEGIVLWLEFIICLHYTAVETKGSSAEAKNNSYYNRCAFKVGNPVS
jgi:hypothetical protein